MALTSPICQETSLVGTIVTQNVSTTDTTIYARFTDEKTGDARTPQATTLYFVLSKDYERFEIIRADSHSTTDGVTTITVNAAGRGLNKYGLPSGSGTGNSHPINNEIGCADTHLPYEVLNKIIDGTEGTSSASFKVGAETDVDITIYAWNGDANAPFIMYDASEDLWVVSNNGVDTITIGGSTATFTGGDGIVIAAGVIGVDLATDPGLEISSTKLRVKIKTNGGVVRDSDGLSVDLTEASVVAGPLASVVSDVTTSAAEINQLDGISANVTDTNLNTMTAGAASDASALHKHAPLIKNGGADSHTATNGGNLTFAHGLGQAPTWLKFTCGHRGTNVDHRFSIGSKTTTEACLYADGAAPNLDMRYNSTIVKLVFTLGTVIGTASLGATNIVISWTTTGGSHSVSYVWEAGA